MWYILNNLPLELWFVCFFFKLISPSFPSLIALSHWWRTLLLFCSSFWVSWSMRVSKQLQNTGHTFFFCGWMWSCGGRRMILYIVPFIGWKWDTVRLFLYYLFHTFDEVMDSWFKIMKYHCLYGPSKVDCLDWILEVTYTSQPVLASYDSWYIE